MQNSSLGDGFWTISLTKRKAYREIHSSTNQANSHKNCLEGIFRASYTLVDRRLMRSTVSTHKININEVVRCRKEQTRGTCLHSTFATFFLPSTRDVVRRVLQRGLKIRTPSILCGCLMLLGKLRQHCCWGPSAEPTPRERGKGYFSKRPYAHMKEQGNETSY